MMRAAAPQDGECVQRRGDETRRRILGAALDLFARDGFEATTVRTIADACGLTDAALYYYFRSKRAILNALWQAPQINALDAVPVRPALTEQVLSELVDAMLAVNARQNAFIRILVQQALAGDPIAVAMHKDAMARWRRYLTPHFEASFDRDDAALRVDLFMMLTIGLTFSDQMDHGAAYASLGLHPAYRERVKAIANIVLGPRDRAPA